MISLEIIPMKLLLYKNAKKKYVVNYNKRCYSFIEIEDCLNYAMDIGEYLTDIDAYFLDYIKKTGHRIQRKGGFIEFCNH